MAPVIYCVFNTDNATQPMQWEPKRNLIRPSSAYHWTGMVNSEGFSSANQYADTQHRIFVMSTNGGAVLDLKVLRFYLGAGGNFGPASYVAVDWIY